MNQFRSRENIALRAIGFNPFPDSSVANFKYISSVATFCICFPQQYVRKRRMQRMGWENCVGTV